MQVFFSKVFFSTIAQGQADRHHALTHNYPLKGGEKKREKEHRLPPLPRGRCYGRRAIWRAGLITGAHLHYHLVQGLGDRDSDDYHPHTPGQDINGCLLARESKKINKK